MRRIKASQARDYFQERVKTCNKTLTDMVDIIRRHPAEFTGDDVEKVRAYMSAQIDATVKAMAIATTTAVRTEFDFDMELPKAPVFQDRSEIMRATRQEAQLAPRTVNVQAIAGTALSVVTDENGIPMREKPAGRLYGSEEVVKELVPLVPQRKVKVKEDPKTVPDARHGGIEEAGFVEE